MWYIGSVLWRKPDKLLKNGFLHRLRELKMKRFLSKIWHLKFSFLSFSKFTIFAKKMEPEEQWPVNGHLISWPSKAPEKYMVKK